MNKEYGFLMPAEYHYYDSTIEVIKNASGFGLNSFILTEDKLSEESQINIYDWLAAFPQVKDDSFFNIAFVNGDYDYMERLRRFYGEVAGLEIPERIKNLKINPDPFLADDVTEQLAVNCRPSIIVARGEEPQTRKQLMILFCPQGMPPQEALAFIQESARDKYWELTAQAN